MDPLSHYVSLLRPHALRWKAAEARGDWAIRFPASPGLAFCHIVSGSCSAVLGEQGALHELGAGDCLLLCQPSSWILRGGAAASVVDLSTLLAERPALLGTGGEDGVPVRLVGGHFHLDATNAGLLNGLLPRVVQVSNVHESAGRLKNTIEAIGDEALAGRPGQDLVLTRLIEVLIVEVMRQQAFDTGGALDGLLAGLANPGIARALGALHADYRRNWTVASLATVAGVARSSFAASFARIVGVPPMTYLLHWRMALAKDWLRSGTRSQSEIAFACGYHSVSAFSTAFSRETGCAPAAFARRFGERR